MSTNLATELNDIARNIRNEPVQRIEEIAKESNRKHDWRRNELRPMGQRQDHIVNTTRTIAATILATIACYFLAITFLTWALPPGQVSIPHLAVGLFTGLLAYLMFNPSAPLNVTTKSN